jgi:hypothetical protein
MLEGARVFPADPIRSTHELQAEQDREFGPFHRHGWGFGWDLGTWEGRTIVHRFGSFPGYRSHMSFDPESGVGVIVLVNGGGPASPATDLVARYVYDRLLGREDLEAEYERRLAELELARAQADRDAVEARETRRARQKPLAHPPEGYAGTYASPTLGTMTWRVTDEGLVAEMGVARSAAEVYDAAKDELRVELTGGGSVVAFEFPPGGGPAAALVIEGERFERVGD